MTSNVPQELSDPIQMLLHKVELKWFEGSFLAI